MKVLPFHTTKGPRVYHDNSKCGPGKEIPLSNRVKGTGGKPHCLDCARLAGK